MKIFKDVQIRFLYRKVKHWARREDHHSARQNLSYVFQTQKPETTFGDGNKSNEVKLGKTVPTCFEYGQSPWLLVKEWNVATSVFIWPPSPPTSSSGWFRLRFIRLFFIFLEPTSSKKELENVVKQVAQLAEISMEILFWLLGGNYLCFDWLFLSLCNHHRHPNWLQSNSGVEWGGGTLDCRPEEARHPGPQQTRPIGRKIDLISLQIIVDCDVKALRKPISCRQSS